MIWNGESKGTFGNILNLLDLNKELIIYYTLSKKFYSIKNAEDFNNFLRDINLPPNLLKLI